MKKLMLLLVLVSLYACVDQETDCQVVKEVLACGSGKRVDCRVLLENGERISVRQTVVSGDVVYVYPSGFAEIHNRFCPQKLGI